MDGIYGIVGMSTGLTKLTKDDGPVLITSLYKNDIISEPVFGWFMSDEDNDSYIDIGYLAEDSIREGEELAWISVFNDDFWWTNMVTGVRLKGNSYQTPRAFALTDTGTSCVYVPTEFYYALEALILADVLIYYDDDNDVIFNC